MRARSSSASERAALGHRLWRMRRRFYLNQAQFGRIIGCSFAQYSKYERGETKIPFAAILDLCRVLKLVPGDFVPDDEDRIEAAARPRRVGRPCLHARRWEAANDVGVPRRPEGDEGERSDAGAWVERSESGWDTEDTPSQGRW